MPVPYHEAEETPRSPHPSPSNSKWGPYANAGDFSANMAVILVILFCALVLALALNAAIRYLLCPQRRRRGSVAEDPEKNAAGSKGASRVPKSEVGPILVYSAAAAAGIEAECAICLSEFAEGERVRVLAACGHGFHDACIERWLGTGVRRSCPTCRSSCHVAPVGPEGKSGVVDGV